MKKMISVLLLFFSSLLCSNEGISSELSSLWKQMSLAQKVLFLSGYHQGVSAICATTAKDVTLKKLREKYNSDISKPETWPPLSEIEEETDQTYENCIILNGIKRNQTAESTLNFVIKTIDYSYIEKKYDTSLLYLITMCSRLESYKECVDEAGERGKLEK